MDPFTKDIVQTASWIAAIVVGFVAAFKALQELAETRRLRAEDLRWKKAQLAREVLTRFNDDRLFNDAVTMLDWTGREYDTAPGRRERIAFDDLRGALEIWTAPRSFTPKEVHIRDAFDALFEAMDLLEHYLRTGLLVFEDIEFPMSYNVMKLREHWSAVEPFMRAYGYELSLAFVGRFPNRASNV